MDQELGLMAKTVKLEDVKCPFCKHGFESSKSENIQCRKCGKRFDL